LGVISGLFVDDGLVARIEILLLLLFIYLFIYIYIYIYCRNNLQEQLTEKPKQKQKQANNSITQPRYKHLKVQKETQENGSHLGIQPMKTATH
jgi:uncharacterized ion transporter superfamily protein YfcC